MQTDVSTGTSLTVLFVIVTVVTLSLYAKQYILISLRNNTLSVKFRDDEIVQNYRSFEMQFTKTDITRCVRTVFVSSFLVQQRKGQEDNYYPVIYHEVKLYKTIRTKFDLLCAIRIVSELKSHGKTILQKII